MGAIKKNEGQFRFFFFLSPAFFLHEAAVKTVGSCGHVDVSVHVWRHPVALKVEFSP